VRSDVPALCWPRPSATSAPPLTSRPARTAEPALARPRTMRRILCIGAGYVGGPTMSVIGKHCPDVEVVVADINPERVADWQSWHAPIFEPVLQDVVQAPLGRNLRFTADVEGEIGKAEMIFVSVN